MPLIDRYLTRRFLLVFLISLTMLVCVQLALALNSQLIRFISKGLVAPTEIMLMMVYPALQFLGLSVLFSTALAATLWLRSLCQDNNNISLLNTGRSVFRFTAGATTAACALAIALLVYNLLIVHKVYLQYFDLVVQLRTRESQTMVREKEFVSFLDEYIFYANKTDIATGDIQGFVMGIKQENDKKNIVVAKGAKFQVQDGRNFVTIQDGNYFTFPLDQRDETFAISFEESHPNIEDEILPEGSLRIRTNMLPVSKLFAVSNGSDPTEAIRARKFLHRRLSEPFVVLSSVAIMLLVMGSQGVLDKRRRNLILLIGGIASVAIIIAQAAGISLIGTEYESIALIYVGPFTAWSMVLLNNLRSKLASR